MKVRGAHQLIRHAYERYYVSGEGQRHAEIERVMRVTPGGVDLTEEEFWDMQAWAWAEEDARKNRRNYVDPETGTRTYCPLCAGTGYVSGGGGRRRLCSECRYIRVGRTPVVVRRHHVEAVQFFIDHLAKLEGVSRAEYAGVGKRGRGGVQRSLFPYSLAMLRDSGLTQSELAEATGLSQASVSRLIAKGDALKEAA